MPMKGVKSAKRQRQYEHVKESELEQGRGEERASEIAARTVNKQRRASGETKDARGSGGAGGRKRAAKKSSGGSRGAAKRTRASGASRTGGGSRTRSPKKTAKKR
jgi:hypothetical protein